MNPFFITTSNSFCIPTRTYKFHPTYMPTFYIPTSSFYMPPSTSIPTSIYITTSAPSPLYSTSTNSLIKYQKPPSTTTKYSRRSRRLEQRWYKNG